VFVPVAAVVLGLVGCAEQTHGHATYDGGTSASRPTIPTPGGDTGTSQPTDTTGEPTGTTSSGGPGIGGLRPCDLLTSAEQARFNLGPGVEDKIGQQARGCQWQASGQYTIGVGVLDNRGLADVVADGPKTPMKVGTHDAVKYIGDLGLCGIAIGVTATSRVDVTGVAYGDEAKACTIANQAARLVEPKLP